MHYVHAADYMEPPHAGTDEGKRIKKTMHVNLNCIEENPWEGPNNLT